MQVQLRLILQQPEISVKKDMRSKHMYEKMRTHNTVDKLFACKISRYVAEYSTTHKKRLIMILNRKIRRNIMNQLHVQISNYLNYCEFQKMLDKKTLKAYRIDLSQFSAFFADELEPLTKDRICQYIQELHAKYKEKAHEKELFS
jgi:Site-specific recombinase XerD